MKKCKSCGALQKDERTVCIDCGQRLGEPLTKRELKALEDGLETQLDDGLETQLDEMADRCDDFHVSRFDYVLIALHAVLSVALIVVTLINPNNVQETGRSLLWGLILNVLAAVELLFPAAIWSLHVGVLSFRYANADDLEPGWGWKITRKAVSFIAIALTAFLIYAMLYIEAEKTLAVLF